MRENNEQVIEDLDKQDDQSLWDIAGDMNKYNFVVSLEGKSRFLWISAIILLVVAVILYLVMPTMLPGIDLVELDSDEDIAVAVSSDTVYMVDFDRADAIRYADHDLENVSGIHIGKEVVTLFDLKDKMVQSFNYADSDEVIADQTKELTENLLEASAIITGGGCTFFISTTSIVLMRKNGDMEVIDDVPKIRYPSSITADEETIWMGDFDRIIRIDNGINSITPFEYKPIKHVTTIDGDLAIIYENGLFIRIDEDGETVNQQNLSPWTNYRQTAVSDTEGEVTISANKLTLQMGYTTDSSPSKRFVIKREDEQ